MKIIIDDGKSEFNGEVKPDEFKITSNPKTILQTSDLVSCVGVALLERVNNKVLKRGLAHVHYHPGILKQKFEHKDEYTMIPTREEIRAVKLGLDESISHFKDPRAILIFNTFKESRMGNLENPMANYIFRHLIDEGVILHFPNNLTNKTLAGKYVNAKTELYNWGETHPKTYYKNVGLQNNKLVVMHLSRPQGKAKFGTWLNKGEECIPLDLNI